MRIKCALQRQRLGCFLGCTLSYALSIGAGSIFMPAQAADNAPSLNTPLTAVATYVIPERCIITTIVPQSDGKLLAAGLIENKPRERMGKPIVAKPPDPAPIDKAPHFKTALDNTSLETPLRQDWVLLRYNKTGSLDSTFAGDGLVSQSFGLKDSIINALAVQSDGKIIVAGNAKGKPGALENNRSLLARYNADGSFDNTFGEGGIVRVTVHTPAPPNTSTPQTNDDSLLSAVVIQKDGKILTGGRDSTSKWLYLARYNSDSSLDKSFGTAGQIIFPGFYLHKSLNFQEDGTIIVPSTNDRGFIQIARLYSDGSFDKTFGENGIAQTFLSDNIRAFFPVAHKKILVSSNTFLARLRPDGSFDTSFSPDHTGKVASYLALLGYPVSTALQTDEKIIVVAYALSHNVFGDVASHFYIIRFNSDGSRDTTFGITGSLTAHSGYIECAAYIYVLRLDGQIIAVGSAPNYGTRRKRQTHLTAPPQDKSSEIIEPCNP